MVNLFTEYLHILSARFVIQKISRRKNSFRWNEMRNQNTAHAQYHILITCRQYAIRSTQRRIRTLKRNLKQMRTGKKKYYRAIQAQAAKKTAERLVRWKCNRDEILFWSDRIRPLSTRINDQTQLFNFSVGIVWCFTRILVFLLFLFLFSIRYCSLNFTV